ncbi:hypothetical protein RGQ29_014116 [Quercus rubra]|uniref:Uncharacterized protein n=1 Tax=Quercus rubra TaxID=3512 RepID=A0AAN7J067_QUERU|nr:hypothetical protein RGQ29_014116 [Quercus rubra]
MMLEMMRQKQPTRELFPDGLDLRKWVASAFPKHIMDVIDASLKQEADSWGSSCALQRLGQCCIEIVEAVLKCTMRIHKKQQSVFGKAEECFEGTRILKTKHGKEDIWVVMLVIK